MNVQNYRHATEEMIPRYVKAGYEVVAFIYWRSGQPCFLMREKPKYEHQAKSGEPKE